MPHVRQSGKNSADIRLVVSNRPHAGGLAKAAEAGIATAVVDHKDYPSREAFDKAVTAKLEEAGVEFVCLAGFMRLLTPWFVERWRDRLINIHPSLLPSFKGLDTHERALEAGVKVHGCSVHFVRSDVDSGPIIAQAAVAVLDEDDADSLATRVLEQEHVIYPLALRLVASGRVRVIDERVEIGGAGDAPPALVVPAV
ncbi:MAG TPA: phosphoribosylglycinamide formyltransferase [Kaistiaceae bacterium]|nr:phosphoribosylglycinamide formyltransferase [Kaistiaceae bacterium]